MVMEDRKCEMEAKVCQMEAKVCQMEAKVCQMEALRQEYQALVTKLEHLKALVQRIDMDVLLNSISQEETPLARLELDKVKDLLTELWGQGQECEDGLLTVKPPDLFLPNSKPSPKDRQSVDDYLDRLGLAFTHQEVMDACNRFIKLFADAVDESTPWHESSNLPTMIPTNKLHSSSPSCDNFEPVTVKTEQENGDYGVTRADVKSVQQMQTPKSNCLRGKQKEGGVKENSLSGKVERKEADVYFVSTGDVADNVDEIDDQSLHDSNSNGMSDFEQEKTTASDQDGNLHLISSRVVPGGQVDDGHQTKKVSRLAPASRETQNSNSKGTQTKLTENNQNEKNEKCLKTNAILKEFGIPSLGLDAASSMTCPVCNKKYQYVKNFIEHLRRHKEKKEREGEQPEALCTVCGKMFKNVSSLYDHLRRHKELDKGEYFKCPVCGKDYLGKKYLQTHVRQCHKEEAYICDTCGKSYSRKASFRIHQRSAHSDVKPEMCRVCNKRFCNKSNLIRHMRIHSGDLRYSCSICARKFSCSSGRNAHEMTHTGKFPYRCSLCEHRGFISSYNLRVHQQKFHPLGVASTAYRYRGWKRSGQEGEIERRSGPPFDCEFCGKQFSNRSNLHRHKPVHTGAKPFKCPTCGRGFNSRDNRRAHMWTHSDVKKFICEICYKGFNDKRNYTSHMERLHPNHTPVVKDLVTTTNTQTQLQEVTPPSIDDMKDLPD